MKKDDNWQQLDSEALRGDSRPRLTQAGIVIGRSGDRKKRPTGRWMRLKKFQYD
jgi:hypothetical protein